MPVAVQSSPKTLLLVAVVLRFEWAFSGDAEVFRLLRAQLGQLDPKMVQVESGNLLIKLGQKQNKNKWLLPQI